MLSVERGGPPPRGAQPPARRVLRSSGHPDVLAFVALAVLISLGLLNLSALQLRSLEYRQLVTVVLGIVLFLVLRRLPASALVRFGWTCYVVSVVLLAAVVVFGSDAYGARRWITIGSSTLQPSELAKAGLILALAHVLGMKRRWQWRLAVALLVAAVPIGLVAVEPDLSTASVLMIMTVAMLVLGRIPLRAMLLLVGAAAVTLPLGEHLLRPYQAERLHAFLSGSRGVGGSGWTILQAHIALAWGGISGQAGQSLNLVLADYLPARETDLAYASLIEQFGLRAGVLAVLAAAVLIWRAAACSRHAAAPTASLAAGGFAVLLATEVSVSVAANLGLLPTAGVPFPLLSSGGSAAAVHIAFAGLVLGQRAQVERHQLWLPPNWRRPHPRLVRATALVLIAGLISMLGVGWQLQHSRGPELRAAGLTQMTRCVTLPAVRGEVTDRHGVALASNRPADDIWTVPKLMSAAQLRHLGALTGLSVATIHRLAAASNNGPFVRLVTVAPAQATRINAAHLPGVWVTPAPRRYYPYGALLGPMLGWTGVATADDMTRWPDLKLGAVVGRAGIEQEYDPVLRGTDGQLCVYVAANGDPVALSRTVAPTAGATLRLSIDLGLQQTFASALSKAMGGGADMGSGVMMDPRDGQILAMVSTPSYDDNLYGPPVQGAKLDQVSGQPGAPMLEHNIQVAAPPGSTFKLAVAAANVTRPVLPPDLVIPTGGSYNLLGHTFRNWSVLPPQNLAQAIAWSNDVYFYKLAWGLGADRIIATARQLGVGQPTGIDLPGESAGYLGTPATVGQIGATWYPGSTVLLGIGQGYITATPLQDARWTAAVATGGLVTPHLGAVIESGHGRSTPVAWPQPQRLPFAAQLGPVRAGMREAVTSGTALALGSLPVPAGAKTGTAEDPGAPVTGEDAWISAVAPIQRPVLEATAFLHGGGGSEPATEPVRAAMAYFFAHQQAIMSTQ